MVDGSERRANIKTHQMKEFNDLLKELGISRREFAEQIGLTYNSIGAMLVEGKPVPKWVLSSLIVARKLKESGI